MSKKLSIVIPVFNKWNFTKSCLNDLSKLPDDHEIIIIDNASSDETVREINSFQDKLSNLVYVRNEENVFHSKACNQGYAISQADVVLFLNNDIRVKSNHQSWTDSLLQSDLLKNSIFGPTMGQLDDKFNFVKEANQQLQGHVYMSGWCLAGHKEVLHKLEVAPNQVWSERYPMYFNDTDLSFRAVKLGIDLKTISLTDVVHFGKVSSSQVNVSKLYHEGRAVFLKDWSR